MAHSAIGMYVHMLLEFSKQWGFLPPSKSFSLFFPGHTL